MNNFGRKNYNVFEPLICSDKCNKFNECVFFRFVPKIAG